MSIGVLSSPLFGDMFGTAAMRGVFGELAFLARCTEAEAALARAQARAGIVPADAAAAISKAAASVIENPQSLDLQRLKRETETVGYPILPLVRQLADRAGDAGRWVHWGATTQDIMDTAVVLQIRAGLELIAADLTGLRGHLAALARRWRDTPMAGRTHLQHALPITFGYKAAVWLAAFDRHATRLAELRPRVLQVQFVGAAGTCASPTAPRPPPEFRRTRPIVDPHRMAKTLGMTHGLIVAEAVMMGLAPHTGRNEAHDLVYDACRKAIESDRPLYDVLLEVSEVAGPHCPDERMALTDPANYLDVAQALDARVHAGH